MGRSGLERDEYRMAFAHQPVAYFYSSHVIQLFARHHRATML
jgi:hypothetical protein